MGAGEIVGLLRRHWLFIVVTALLGAAIGLAWAGTRAPEYTARAEVFITVTSGQSTGELAQGSNFSQQQARNFAALATREIVLAPVIEDLGLDTTVGALRRQVSATVPLNTSLISLEATYSSPELAASIANAAARELAGTVAGVSPKVDDLQGAPVRAQLIERASIPSKPSAPNISLLALFGLLGGVVLAVAIQVVSETAVSRIRTIDQLETTLGAPVLGSIDRNRGVAQQPVAVVASPTSPRAEQVRQIRTSLKYLPGEEHRVFVFSSAVPGEGKSTTSANIAAAFAADGLTTCLIEADLRRPTIADLFDLPNGVGLSDVIAAEFDADDAIQVWGPDRLHVITAGGVPPNPSELLGSERGLAVLRQLQERFEVSIIDTPPVTAVTDASLLGRQFGGLVLVVGAQRARINELRRAMSALRAADIPIRGAILNLAKPEHAVVPYTYELQQAGGPRRLRAGLGRPRHALGSVPIKTVGKVAVALALAASVILGWAALTQRAGEAAGSSAPADQAAQPWSTAGRHS